MKQHGEWGGNQEIVATAQCFNINIKIPIQIIDRGDVYLHKPPPLPEFNNWSIFGAIFSIFSAFFDHGSDIATAYVLWDEPDSKWWFSLTVILIVVPTIIVNAFSLYWY